MIVLSLKKKIRFCIETKQARDGYFSRHISLHIFIQFELSRDSGTNLVVELCVFYRVQNVRTSLSTFLIFHLITLSLACLMLVGILEICFFLQLQGPFDNNANLQIYVFRPLTCQVANCKFWASSSLPPESISTGGLVTLLGVLRLLLEGWPV